jgi:hypothetical protein
MGLFLKSIYLASGLSLLYIFFLYRSHPMRRLSSTTITLTFVVGMSAVIPVALLRPLVVFDRGGLLFSAYVSAGLVEEAVKFAVMMATIWWYGFPDLAEPLDFAIYFGVLGVGFGVYEDFWYIFGSSYNLWLGGDVERFQEIFRAMILARAFPAHILFNALAGFLIGRAYFLGRWPTRLPWLLGGFLVAAATHGTFNLIAAWGGRILLLAYIVVLVGLFIYGRQRALLRSPFRTLIARITQGEKEGWPYVRPPTDYLFAEGFSWPTKDQGGMFQIFPLALSLFILYPVLVSVVYFVHRFVMWFQGG